MTYSYFKMPDAPAPDYGAVVHANQGQAVARQAAINALVQMAEENMKLKAAKEQHAAALAMDTAQLAETTRYHNAETAARQADLDERERAREDLDARNEASIEAANQRQLLTQAANFIRAHQAEQGRMQRHADEEARYAAQAEAHRQEQIKKLEQIKARNSAMQGAMVALSEAPKAFEEHEFSAAEVSPFYSPDPSKMIASIRGSKAMAGKDVPAEEMYNNLIKAKVKIRTAPEGWFANAVGPFAEHLTPEDMMSLNKFAHGKDMVPYASNSAEARGMAYDFFSKHSGVGSLFAGDRAEQATPKPVVDPGMKFQSDVDKKTYGANANTISMMKSLGDEMTPAQKAALKTLEDENAEIVKRHSGGGTPAPAGKTEAEKIDEILKAHPEWTDQQIQDALNGK